MTSKGSSNNVGKLIFFSKAGRAPPYYLESGLTTIGSSHNADIRVKLETVEPLHGVIDVSTDGFVILENKARNNPITVNGIKLRKIQVLKDGDLFQVADKAFQFQRNPQVKEVTTTESNARLKAANIRRSVTPSFKMKATSRIPIRHGPATDCEKSGMKKSLGMTGTPSFSVGKTQKSLSTGKASKIHLRTPQPCLRKSLFMKQVAKKSSKPSKSLTHGSSKNSSQTDLITPKSALRTKRSKSLTSSNNLINFTSPEHDYRSSIVTTPVDHKSIEVCNLSKDSFKTPTSGTEDILPSTCNHIDDPSNLSILSLDTPHSVINNQKFKPSVLSKSLLFEKTTPVVNVKARRPRSASVNFVHYQCNSCTPRTIYKCKRSETPVESTEISQATTPHLADMFCTPSLTMKKQKSKAKTPGVVVDVLDNSSSSTKRSESKVINPDISTDTPGPVVKERKSKIISGDLTDAVYTPGLVARGRRSKSILNELKDTPTERNVTFTSIVQSSKMESTLDSISPRKTRQSKTDNSLFGGMFNTPGSTIKGRRSTANGYGDSINNVNLEDETLSCIIESPSTEMSSEAGETLKSQVITPITSQLSDTVNTRGSNFESQNSKTASANRLGGSLINASDFNETLSSDVVSPVQTRKSKSVTRSVAIPLEDTFTTPGTAVQTRKSRSVAANISDDSVSSADCDELLSFTADSTPTVVKTRRSRSVKRFVGSPVKTRQLKSVSLGSSAIIESPVTPALVKSRNSLTAANDSVITLDSVLTPELGSNTFTSSIRDSVKRTSTLRRSKPATPVIGNFVDNTFSTPGIGVQKLKSKSADADDSCASMQSSSSKLGTSELQNDTSTSTIQSIKSTPVAVKRSKSASRLGVNLLSETFNTSGSSVQTQKSKSIIHSIVNLLDDSVSTPGSVSKSRIRKSVAHGSTTPASTVEVRNSQSTTPVIINLLDDTFKTPAPVLKNRRIKSSTPTNRIGLVASTPAPAGRGRNSSASSDTDHFNESFETSNDDVDSNSLEITNNSELFSAESPINTSVPSVRSRKSASILNNSASKAAIKRLRSSAQSKSLLVQTKNSSKSPVLIKQSKSFSLGVQMCLENITTKSLNDSESLSSSVSKIDKSSGRRGVKRARESTGSTLRINKRLKYKPQDTYKFSLSDSENTEDFDGNDEAVMQNNISINNITINIHSDSSSKSKNSGSKQLRKTPKLQRAPENDLTKIKGLRGLFSPKVQRSPDNNLINIPSFKGIFATPKYAKSPVNDLSNISGVKKLLKTPKSQKSPRNDLTEVYGVKKLLKTPKVAKLPVNDLTRIVGVKKLMTTPKVQKSPLNDLSNISGVKKILKTPKSQKSPRNDLTQVYGVKKLLKTPKAAKLPVNDLTRIVGVKKLMTTPKIQKSPLNDLTNVSGVQELFTSPVVASISIGKKRSSMTQIEEIPVKRVKKRVRIKIPTPDEKPAFKGRKKGRESLELDDMETTLEDMGDEDNKQLDEPKKKATRGKAKGKQTTAEDENNAMAEAPRGKARKNAKKVIENDRVIKEDEVTEKKVRQGRTRNATKKKVEFNEDSEADVIQEEAPRGRPRKVAKKNIENEKMSEGNENDGHPGKIRKNVKKIDENTEDVEGDVTKQEAPRGRTRRVVEKPVENEETEIEVTKKESSRGKYRKAATKPVENEKLTEVDELKEKEAVSGKTRKATKKIGEDEELEVENTKKKVTRGKSRKVAIKGNDIDISEESQETPKERTRRVVKKDEEIEEVNTEVLRGRKKKVAAKVTEQVEVDEEETSKPPSRVRGRKGANKVQETEEPIELNDSVTKETLTRGKGRKGVKKEVVEVAETDDSKTVKKTRGKPKKVVEESVTEAPGRVLRSRR